MRELLLAIWGEGEIEYIGSELCTEEGMSGLRMGGTRDKSSRGRRAMLSAAFRGETVVVVLGVEEEVARGTVGAGTRDLGARSPSTSALEA